jgi:hypothetical protein
MPPALVAARPSGRRLVQEREVWEAAIPWTHALGLEALLARAEAALREHTEPRTRLVEAVLAANARAAAELTAQSVVLVRGLGALGGVAGQGRGGRVLARGV